ncbi:MAG: hypothetical protein Q8O03_03150 [Nanoarchaeota archaeon]|nr:hypothetical protein [Nanoarchaeota archaeon]
MFGFVKRFLTFLAATADLQRFGKWKSDLEDALRKLEEKKGKISKKSYTQQKDVLEGKLKKAKELIEKSKKRLEARYYEIKI